MPNPVNVQLAATSFVPSAEEATETYVGITTLFDVQVLPEFVEVYTRPFADATSLLPSAEQAMENQLAVGAVVTFQTCPNAD